MTAAMKYWRCRPAAAWLCASLLAVGGCGGTVRLAEESPGRQELRIRLTEGYYLAAGEEYLFFGRSPGRPDLVKAVTFGAVAGSGRPACLVRIRVPPAAEQSDARVSVLLLTGEGGELLLGDAAASVRQTVGGIARLDCRGMLTTSMATGWKIRLVSFHLRGYFTPSVSRLKAIQADFDSRQQRLVRDSGLPGRSGGS